MKNYLITLLIGLGIGAAVVHQFYPRVETKIEIQKEVETQTRTTTRRVVLPDGTRTTEQVTDTIKKEREETLSETKSNDWMVGVSASAGLKGFGDVYQATVHRRILGPIFVSVGANTKTEATVGVAVEF